MQGNGYVDLTYILVVGIINHMSTIFLENREIQLPIFKVVALLMRGGAFWRSPLYHASICSKYATLSLGFILSIFRNVFIVRAC